MQEPETIKPRAFSIRIFGCRAGLRPALCASVTDRPYQCAVSFGCRAGLRPALCASVTDRPYQCAVSFGCRAGLRPALCASVTDRPYHCAVSFGCRAGLRPAWCASVTDRPYQCAQNGIRPRADAKPATKCRSARRRAAESPGSPARPEFPPRNRRPLSNWRQPQSRFQ